jgi:hypothetical protein
MVHFGPPHIFMETPQGPFAKSCGTAPKKFVDSIARFIVREKKKKISLEAQGPRPRPPHKKLWDPTKKVVGPLTKSVGPLTKSVGPRGRVVHMSMYLHNHA